MRWKILSKFGITSLIVKISTTYSLCLLKEYLAYFDKDSNMKVKSSSIVSDLWKLLIDGKNKKVTFYHFDTDMDPQDLRIDSYW